MDPIPPDAFLEAYPGGIREGANELRAIVRRAVPGERLAEMLDRELAPDRRPVALIAALIRGAVRRYRSMCH
jgi:hypothetical protein